MDTDHGEIAAKAPPPLQHYTEAEKEELEEVKQQQQQQRRRRRTGIVTLQCPYCPRTITGDPSRSIRTNYNRHLLTHTKERPYKCEFCLAQFTTSTNRRRHILRLHQDMVALLANPPRPPSAAAQAKPTATENSETNKPNLQEADAPMATNTNTNGVWTCRFCEKGFTCKGSRTLHERRCPARPQPARIIPTKPIPRNSTNTTSNATTPTNTNTTSSKGEEQDRVHELCLSSEPGDTFLLCPNCEQELSDRAQLRRHLRCFCPFREDAFASPYIYPTRRGEYTEVDAETLDAPRTHTRRSRRILSRRQAGCDGHRRVRMRCETNSERWTAQSSSSTTTTTTISTSTGTTPFRSSITSTNTNNDDGIHTTTTTDTTTIRTATTEAQLGVIQHQQQNTLCNGETFWSAPPLYGEGSMVSTSSGIPKWNLSAITTIPTTTTVICPYDDCMSTFTSRTRWLVHVARRHPKELQQATTTFSTAA